jgi:hypothetical protein
MAKVEVEIVRGTLALRGGINETIARREVELLQKQAAANISASGGSLGRKKDGSPVTLKQSGDLWSKVDYREEGSDAVVEFRAEHARYVFAEFGGRYDATRLSPGYQQQLENEVATLIEEGAIIKEE